MKRQKRIIASILTAAFLIGGTTSYAGRVGSTLHANEKDAKTPILGNTTELYGFTASNSTSSKYSVEAYMYMGKDSSKLTYNPVKYNMAADLRAYTSEIKAPKKKYTVARARTYGNIKSNPLTGCMASTMLSNR